MERIKYYFMQFFFFLASCTSFAQLNWEQTNGPYGGQTFDIKVDVRGYLYAATQAGLYVSQDNGEHWNKLVNSSGREIFTHPSGKVFFSGFVSDADVKTWKSSNPLSIQMDSKFILYGKATKEIVISKDTAKSWKVFASFTRKITAVFLLNDKTFFASADSGIYSSVDSGKIWKYNNLSSITSYGRLMTSKFAKDSKNNVYLMGFWDLLKSSDGGNTWNKMNLPPASGYNFYSIYINSIDEIFVGATGGIYYSNDNGSNWKNIFSKYEMFYGFCEDSKKDLFCATLGQGVYQYDRLNNKMILKNNGIMANNIQFFDKVNGNFICSAWDCGHFRSSDNGATWTRLSNPGYYKIALNEEGKIFTCGEGIVFYSTDLGTNWQTINLRSNKDYVSELVVNGNTIVAILDDQNINGVYYNDIIKSVDFGKTWKKVYSIQGYSSWNRLTIIDKKNIYLGFDKDLYYSEDIGENWKMIKSFSESIQSITRSPWGNIYVGAYSGLYEKDLLEWNYIKVPWNSPIVRQVSFSSKGEMFVLGFDLFVSNDKGKTFQIVANKAYDVANNFYVDEESGKIFLGTQERGLFVKNYSFYSVNVPTYSILFNNYPNPFNYQTVIEFFINEPGEVKLDIFNSIGEKVYSLNNTISTGYYKLNWQPKNIASGIYFYRLQTPSFSETKKMILLK